MKKRFNSSGKKSLRAGMIGVTRNNTPFITTYSKPMGGYMFIMNNGMTLTESDFNAHLECKKDNGSNLDIVKIGMPTNAAQMKMEIIPTLFGSRVLEWEAVADEDAPDETKSVQSPAESYPGSQPEISVKFWLTINGVEVDPTTLSEDQKRTIMKLTGVNM